MVGHRRWGFLVLALCVASLSTGCCRNCFICTKSSCPAMDPCVTDSLPKELDKVSGPEYVVEPPDVIFIEAINAKPTQPLVGERLIRPDGTINLGYYGDLHVAGLTLREIEVKIEERLRHFTRNPRVHVDMASFNSKVFYVMGQVYAPGRLPWTGGETVLDAITLTGGITIYANKCAINLVRPTPQCSCDIVLPVDYDAIVKRGDTTTNYQILPGDRILVTPTSGYQLAVWLDNVLTPVERILGLINLGRLAIESDNN